MESPSSFLDSVSPEIEHLVREALQSQGDLREYSKNIEKELHEVKIKTFFPIIYVIIACFNSSRALLVITNYNTYNIWHFLRLRVNEFL